MRDRQAKKRSNEAVSVDHRATSAGTGERALEKFDHEDTVETTAKKDGDSLVTLEPNESSRKHFSPLSSRSSRFSPRTAWSSRVRSIGRH
jgi:hypothetical protein